MIRPSHQQQTARRSQGGAPCARYAVPLAVERHEQDWRLRPAGFFDYPNITPGRVLRCPATSCRRAYRPVPARARRARLSFHPRQCAATGILLPLARGQRNSSLAAGNSGRAFGLDRHFFIRLSAFVAARQVNFCVEHHVPAKFADASKNHRAVPFQILRSVRINMDGVSGNGVTKNR